MGMGRWDIPDSTNVVNRGLTILVAVCHRIGGQAGTVQVRSDSSSYTTNPSTHGVVGCTCVGGLEVDSDGHEIGPSFTHTARFSCAQAGRVGGTSGQSVGETVSVFVDDNTGIERTVTLDSEICPKVHSHARGGTICWGSEVGVVGTGSVLSVEDYGVISNSTLAVIVGFKVTCCLRCYMVSIDSVNMLVRSKESLLKPSL